MFWRLHRRGFGNGKTLALNRMMLLLSPLSAVSSRLPSLASGGRTCGEANDLTGIFVPAGVRENSLWREAGMPMRKYKPEQIVTLLRQVEVGLANGKSTPQACKEAEITAQTYYRWRKEFGGLKLDQAKRLKELERENAKLKRLVAELSLEKQILKDVAEGNF